MSYLGLAMCFVAPAAIVLVLAGRRRGRHWWATTALTIGVLLVLTVLFDNLMIHIDLFRYDDSALTGQRLLLAPIEDLAWPLVAALLLPGLWVLFDRASGEEGR